MKKMIVFWIFVLQQCCIGAQKAQECTVCVELQRAAVFLCKHQRDNQTLWGSVIECHRPLTDEFMRSSAEALCPVPKHVPDPTDTRYSMEEVFFNICGLIDGNPSQIMEGYSCMVYGRCGIKSHEAEVKEVKERWGEDVPYKIGECIKQLGPDLA